MGSINGLNELELYLKNQAWTSSIIVEHFNCFQWIFC
jgi:hypothetical protein